MIKKATKTQKVTINYANAIDYCNYLFTIYSYAIDINDIVLILSSLEIDRFIDYEEFIKEYKLSIVLNEELRNRHNSLCEKVLNSELFSFFDGNTLNKTLRILQNEDIDNILLSIIYKKGIVLKFIKKFNKILEKKNEFIENYDDRINKAKLWDEKKMKKYLIILEE